MRRKKKQASISIGIAVSFDGSSKNEPVIVIVRTVGSTVTVTALGSITRDGMKFIPHQDWNRMLENNGTKATEGMKVTGSIEFTLPWPPSVNTYWRAFDGRMIISAKGREYRETVGDQMTLQGTVRHFTGSLRVTIEAWRPDKRRRDLDNLLKAALDGLAHAGVYEDDSQIVDLRIYWAPDIGGMLKVKIEEIE